MHSAGTSGLRVPCFSALDLLFVAAHAPKLGQPPRITRRRVPIGSPLPQWFLRQTRQTFQRPQTGRFRRLSLARRRPVGNRTHSSTASAVHIRRNAWTVLCMESSAEWELHRHAGQMGKLSEEQQYQQYKAWCEQCQLPVADKETWQRTRNTVSEAVLEHDRGTKRRPARRPVY